MVDGSHDRIVDFDARRNVRVRAAQTMSIVGLIQS